MAARFRQHGPHEAGAVEMHPANMPLPYRLRTPQVLACQINYGDLFHERVPEVFIVDALSVACAASHHRQIVFITKRPARAAAILRRLFAFAPPPPHVLILASAWDQASADAAWGALGFVVPRWGLHLEPLLGPVMFGRGAVDRPSWIAVGGENGPGSRRMDPSWASLLWTWSAATRVPFWFKGWGSAPADRMLWRPNAPIISATREVPW